MKNAIKISIYVNKNLKTKLTYTDNRVVLIIFKQNTELDEIKFLKRTLIFTCRNVQLYSIFETSFL